MNAEEKNDQKLLFDKCKQSVEDVTGWKVFIFLPFNLGWRFFIVIVVSASFLLIPSQIYFEKKHTYHHLAELVCDIFFVVDVICVTTHYILKETRKLRHGKPRSLILLTIDYVSLIPTQVVYQHLIFHQSETEDVIFYFLHLNVCMRVYLVYTTFAAAKLRIPKVKTYFIVCYMELILYNILLAHFCACIMFMTFNAEEKAKCRKNIAYCMIENDFIVYVLHAQTVIRSPSGFKMDENRIFVALNFVYGYVFTYGYVLPTLLFVGLKYLRAFFEYYNRCKQLELLLKNTITGKELRKKTKRYFQSLWMYGQGNRYPPVIDIFPVCFQKNIFVDMHWDMFRHSDFLNGISTGCKRSLSLHIATEFIVPSTILLEKNERKTFVLYIASGILEISAEENAESPVATFSSGTVLGESSLFVQGESKATLRTSTFSTVHILNIKDLFRVLLDYPQDVKKIYKRMKFRMEIAKATQLRKKKICQEFLRDDTSYMRVINLGQANVKWLKQQSRALYEMDKTYKIIQKSQEKQQEAISVYKRQAQSLKTRLEHTSCYIHLFAMHDNVVYKHDAVCMKMSMPWVVDPQSHFLLVWNRLILTMAFVSSLLYPAYIGWVPYLPTWFFDLTVITTFFYGIDVVMQLFTAVNLKNGLISKFSKRMVYRLLSITFYIDIIAALPLQVINYFSKIEHYPYETGLYLSNGLLKFYRIIVFFNQWNYTVKSNAVIRTFVKYIFLLNIAMYWLAAFFKLASIECLFYDCGEGDWYSIFEKNQGSGFRDYISVFLAVFVGLDIPHEVFVTDLLVSFVIFFFAFVFFNTFFILWRSECVSAYVWENSHEIKYKNLMKFVSNFMRSRRIARRVQNRVIDTMQFQWYYDLGNYLTHERRILDDVNVKLKDEINRESILSALQQSPLFSSESDDFHMDLCRKSHRMVMPAHSVLVTYGTRTMKLYVIFKGYVQLNSFLPGDIIQNVGTPVILSKGDAFPVVAAFKQIPSSISARTITDCELIVLDLEDVLSTMVMHGALKDFVDAVKTITIQPFNEAKLGFSRVPDVFFVDDKAHQAVFKKLKCFGSVLKPILLRRAIDPESTWYIRWEFFRVLCIVVNLALWPFVFGCLYDSDTTYLVYFLLAVDNVAWIDFYIRLHLAYYNYKGICVTHPLITSAHYLTTSFVLDVMSVLPSFHYVYLLANDVLFSGLSLSVTHMLLRALGLYRLFGFVSYMKNSRFFFQTLGFVKYAVIFTLVLNCCMNLLIYNYLVGMQRPVFRLTPNETLSNTPYMYYIRELSITIMIMLRIQLVYEDYNFLNVIRIITLAILGWIISIYLTAFLTLSSFNENLSFAHYQHDLKSYITFLRQQNTDDVIAQQAMDHVIYEWDKKKGKDLQRIFSRFPDILHEDLMFPVYKVTLSSVQCLSAANEAFYRILSRNVDELHLKKGSIIIFKQQVLRDIFFIHKGRCYVSELSKTLYPGSMIGDIRNLGIMKNTITADTHVDLLKISSKIFFITMSNFHGTKMAFESEIVNVDDFVESTHAEAQDTEVAEQTLFGVEKKDIDESAFVIANSDEQGKREKAIAKITKARGFKLILNPNSIKIRIFEFVFLIDAYLTVLLIPIFIAVRNLSLFTIITIYSLDIVWLGKIIVNGRTAYVNPKTGNLIVSVKGLMAKYVLQGDGFILDILSIIPLEIFPFVYYMLIGFEDTCRITMVFYYLRLLRFFFIISFARKRKKKPFKNFFILWLIILSLTLLEVNFVASFNALVSEFVEFQCTSRELNQTLRSFEQSYFLTLNNYVGGGVIIRSTKDEILKMFDSICAIWAFISKANLVNQVLKIIYVTSYAKSDQMHQIHLLERYLKVRDVSPSLLKKTRNYYCNIMETYKGGAMPLFLKTAPDFIRVNIMRDAYESLLTNCYLFRGVNRIYLTQLSARLERYIFLPGDYIALKGDVDHKMYFIYTGEVYCIEKDREYKALEIVVNLYNAEACFGELQGLLLFSSHMFTYRAKTEVIALVLKSNNWEDLRLTFPEITKSIFVKVINP